MSDGQPDVLIEVKHLDPLPVDVFRVGQRLEKIQLGGSCCSDDTGAPTIEDRTAHGSRRLVGSRSAQRYLVFKHSHDHPEISSVSLTKSASSTWLIARVFIPQPMVVTNDLTSRSVGRPAHLARSPAPQGRIVMRDCLHSTYCKLFYCIQMPIENSGRIKHLKKMGPWAIYHVRSEYHRACLRCPLRSTEF